MNGQIKSKERVRKFGEVFTNSREVKAMCDLISPDDDAWTRIDAVFCDPACGNGNFLVEILERKYKRCQSEKDGLKALASVFGVEIQLDNCEECRARLLKQYIETFPHANELAILIASGILRNNIVNEDGLEFMRCIYEVNNGLEHDYNLTALEWCKKTAKREAQRRKIN